MADKKHFHILFCAFWALVISLTLNNDVFAALKCYDCHGTIATQDKRPEDAAFRNPSSGGFQGDHRNHIAIGATPNACQKCHPGSANYNSRHRDGNIKLADNINASAHPSKARYINSTSSTYLNYTSFPQSPDKIGRFYLGTCNNVNCHFEKPTPTWGSDPSFINCATCHSTPPSDGSHGKKHGQTYGNSIDSCTKCHPDHSKDGNVFAHATSAGKRGLRVQFTTPPNKGGMYSGTSQEVKLNYPEYLPSQNPPRNGSCNTIYCHSDGAGHPPNDIPQWSTSPTTKCDSCHRYQGAGFRNMTSNGHTKLADYRWIRKYPCTYCHSKTVASVTPVPGKPPVDGAVIMPRLVNGAFSSSRHVNGIRDVAINPFWRIEGSRKVYPLPSYNPQTMVCDNVYCHSDGTTDPESIRAFPWNVKGTNCNSCHGHQRGEDCTACHNGTREFTINSKQTVLSIQTGWPAGQEWMSAMPMFANEGVGKPRANSHPRHMQSNFSCSECHFQTIQSGGDCKLCHDGSLGKTMGEASHLNPDFHVNTVRDVHFKQGGSYDPYSKSCSGTKCHSGDDPKWGDSANNAIICVSCHGTESENDVDDFGNINGIKAQISLPQWRNTGHGRKTASGNYKSGNPAANFPGNPCWYCHDNKVLHNYSGNPFRLKIHSQIVKRYEHECVYCHMERTDVECLSCHNETGSLAPQLSAIFGSISARWPNGTVVTRPNHSTMHNPATKTATSCVTSDCHYVDPANPTQDMKIHNNGSTKWSKSQKDDVKNQYQMMGVCLQCHDDDSNNKCNGCHDGTLPRYQLGYDPGTGYIKPSVARASSVHFGYKHYKKYVATGTWSGGKFCWDCHDPHGDNNIYMIHDKVATETDGKYGIPTPNKRASVVFTQKVTGEDYAKSTGTINGICNVCHSTSSKHYRSDGGDEHNTKYPCTKCHEHRFTDSHADKKACNTCHKNKPVPRHSGFGLPMDCVKCHNGNVGGRVDVIGQFMGSSHHVQGIPISNKHCYQCHWESTPNGLINPEFHEGFNFRNYSSVKNAKVDLVLYGPGNRPMIYKLYSSAIQFTAAKIKSSDINIERTEVAKITNHCLSCHSDKNNRTKPFDDCKTPRQYAWDLNSIDARYSQKGSTKWGKYSTTTSNVKYKVTKAFSAHGNATDNQGGWNASTGTDSNVTNTRPGFTGMSSVRRAVQCFDCHNSHGSKAGGVTSSYASYSGLKNGANLKEVTKGKGGYEVNYSAKPKPDDTGVVNPYNAGAGQCFDCHLNAVKAAPDTDGPPWGYQSTFNASQPIKGFRDGYKFGDRNSDPYKLAPGFKNVKTIKGGHFKASSPLKKGAMEPINGLCTPCHDPHGVSPTLGGLKDFAVPLLKDTWMSSPYKEDFPADNPSGPNATAEAWGTVQSQGRKYPAAQTPYNVANEPTAKYNLDRNTLGANARISQDDTKFAGLCLKCHTKKAMMGNYTGAANSSNSPNKQPWKSVERIHASTKGWGSNKEHSFSCSKCHQPHNSALPRLMQTNCLDYQHRGNVASGGAAWSSLKALANVNSVGLRDAGCTSSTGELRGYPVASLLGKGNNYANGVRIWDNYSPEATISCHTSRTDAPNYETEIKNFRVRDPSRVSGKGASGLPSAWPNGNYWNVITPWPESK
jgi:predicted CxxxxCH...CXXCH cytochrome family protein